MALSNQIKKDDFISLFKNNSSLLTKPEEKLRIEQSFTKLDFPSKKDEEWQHTNIKRLLQHKFSLVNNYEIDKHIIERFTIPNLNAYRMVFVNGNFIEEYSDIQDIENKIIVINSKEAKNKHVDLFNSYHGKTNEYSQNLFSNINSAYASDGSFIFVNKNVEIDKYIHIINLSDGHNSKAASQYRNIVVLQANSKIKIINTFHSLSVNYTFTNVVNEIILKENAHLNFNILQGEGNDTFQINHTKVQQEKSSNFSSHTITLCGAIVRNDINVEHLDEACETNLYGLYLPDREQHFDNNLFVHHAKPYGISNQIYRGIIDNTASAVFLGKVLVDKGAQKTFADQSNRNVLLTDYARVNSKPQLEIYADDVACSHGSTTGQIDREALFYLQSRGIERRQAESLLLNAFLTDVVDSIESESFKFLIKSLVDKRLKGELLDNQCSMAEVCMGCEL